MVSCIYLSSVVCDDHPVGGDMEEFGSERVPHQLTLGLRVRYRPSESAKMALSTPHLPLVDQLHEL